MNEVELNMEKKVSQQKNIFEKKPKKKKSFYDLANQMLLAQKKTDKTLFSL